MQTLNAIGNAIADEIEANGHQQQIPRKQPSNVCVVNSLAMKHSGVMFDVCDAICRALGLPTGPGRVHAVVRWNDRTKTEKVLAVLRSL